jgi:hypothetical protein
MTTHEVRADARDALILVDPRTGDEAHLPARDAEYLLAALILTNRRYALPEYSDRPVRDVNTDVRGWLTERLRVARMERRA